jgi:hypothetical protein
MTLSRPPDHEAGHAGEEQDYSTEPVDRLAGLSAEQVGVQVAYPIVKGATHLPHRECLPRVRVKDEFSNRFVVSLSLKNAWLGRAARGEYRSESNAWVRSFQSVLECLQRYAVRTWSRMDRSNQCPAKLRQEDGETAGQSHESEIEADANAGPLVRLKDPETQFGPAWLVPQ